MIFLWRLMELFVKNPSETHPFWTSIRTVLIGKCVKAPQVTMGADMNASEQDDFEFREFLNLSGHTSLFIIVTVKYTDCIFIKLNIPVTSNY